MTVPRAERPAAMVAAYAAGATLAEVGQSFSVSRQRVQQILRRVGVTTRGTAETHALRHQQLLESARAAIAEGANVAMIAAGLGVSSKQARRLAQDAGAPQSLSGVLLRRYCPAGHDRWAPDGTYPRSRNACRRCRLASTAAWKARQLRNDPTYAERRREQQRQSSVAYRARQRADARRPANTTEKETGS
ncbi:MAG: hypothetical protein NUW22_08280 [Acidobacteria bacterium]|nr:hypothetical protein [Acidobacteriota bacterium]